MGRVERENTPPRHTASTLNPQFGECHREQPRTAANYSGLAGVTRVLPRRIGVGGVKGGFMPWKRAFTDRAEDALDRTRIALRQHPSALASAELLKGIDESGPSLARGVLTALEANTDEILDHAQRIAGDQGTAVALARLQCRPATLDIIVRRAMDEAVMLGHRRVGTEHLLLAIISVHDDPTTCALRDGDVTQDTARGTLRRLLPSWTDDGCPRGHVSVA